MPKKIRELKAMLRKAGFTYRPAKGSHSFWSHPAVTSRITLAGADGERYQEKAVQNALEELKKVQGE